MLLYILLAVHFLADFTFQTRKVAEKKVHKNSYLIIHALIYAGVFLPVLFLAIKFEKAVLSYMIIIGSHFLIDWFRKAVEQKYTSFRFFSFLADQVLHILILVIVYYAFDLSVSQQIIIPTYCNFTAD
ncbi:MAG TPA: DUF3307 domain-containing protein [Lachnospiraceae bacterium]|nr:DUF3307 domain-containing protein [Lachnospiraceae bacterium]